MIRAIQDVQYERSPLGKSWGLPAVTQDDARDDNQEAASKSNKTTCKKRPKAR
jgi:hypothetical protein